MNIDVTVSNVDMASVVGTHRVHDPEDGYYQAPMTLGDAVAKEIAEDLKKDKDYPGLARRVKEIRDEEIRALIRPTIEAAIQAPIQKTNTYGEPTGQTTSLTELIVHEAQKYLTTPADQYNRDRGTVLQKMVREEIGAAFKRELAAVIADEKAKVVAAVQAQAAELIAEAVRQGVGR